MAAKDRTLTVKLIGTAAGHENIHLSDFLGELKSINTTLKKLDYAISKKSTLYFQIKDLSHSSPATVVIEAVPKKIKVDYSHVVVDKFVKGVKCIQLEKPPTEFDLSMLNTFGYIGSTITQKKKMRKIVLTSNGDSVDLVEPLSAPINRFLGEDEEYSGNVSGILEALNVHGDKDDFYIFPVAGAQRIRCNFPEHLIDTAISSVKKYLNLTGTVIYKQRARFPHEIDVEEMEVYPDESDLPDLKDLFGMAPKATKGVDSVEFVDNLRPDE